MSSMPLSSFKVTSSVFFKKSSFTFIVSFYDDSF